MNINYGRPSRRVHHGRHSGWIGLLLLSILLTPLNAFAKGPAPLPADFNFGAQVDHGGDHLGIAFFLASELGLDWVGMDFNWAQAWPNPAAKPDLSYLGQALTLAEEGQLPVLLKVTAAPAWAMTATGPDPGATADLVTLLVNQSPALQAIELFPGANTFSGWGTNPDPVGYLNLARTVQSRLNQANHPVLLIAAGLTPLPPDPHPADLDDLQFLDKMYQNNGAALLSNLSVRLTEITGTPNDSPFSPEKRVLRHYESVRQLMLRYDHQEGMIWITGFTWPSGKISPDDSKFGDPDLQAQWLHQAYNLLSAQLYIKIAFFDRLNPPRGDADLEHQYHSLIRPAGNFHPGLRSLSQIISFGGSNPLLVPERILLKKLQFWKTRLKPDL